MMKSDEPVGRIKCTLCKSERYCTPFSEEEFEGRIYSTVRCPDCKAYQVKQQYDLVSPIYQALNDDNLDPHHIWLQSEHKQAAFEQWSSLMIPRLESRERPFVLLDIGCGVGSFLDYSSSHGLSAYGFDASVAQVRLAKARGANVYHATTVDQFRAQLHNLDFTPGIVTLWDVLEHIRNPVEFLKEVSCLQSTGGYLFVSVPSGGALKWKHYCYSLLGTKLALCPWEHVYYHTAASLASVLNSAGYEMLDSGAVVCYPRPLSLPEILRRVAFAIFRYLPSVSPQLYAIARRR
jgi:2-polyprenyl-3-methyl-5-hydroxy-6-metoxy-1,4-benzoquinol methylase